MPIRETSELPSAAALWESLLRSVREGVFSFRRNGDQARQKSRAAMLLCKTRLRFGFAGVDAVEWGKHTSVRRLRGGDTSAGSQLRSPPRTYPCRGAQSDVRGLLKRSRRSRGGAVAAAEKTSRTGRNICTVHYFGGLATDFCARDLTRCAEKEPIMATKWTTRHVGCVALVVVPAKSAGHTKRQRTSAKLLTPRRVRRVSSACAWRYFPTGVERRPRAA